MDEARTELAQVVRDAIFAMHGGPIKFDLWLTDIADRVANPDAPGVRMPEAYSYICKHAHGIMSNPRSVVDYLLETLHDVGVWEYPIQNGDGILKVMDPVSGHVIEVLVSTPENLKSLSKKYEVGNGLSNEFNNLG